MEFALAKNSKDANPRIRTGQERRMPPRLGEVSPSRKMYWYGIVASGLTAAAWTTLYIRGHGITHENGWMENQQALCLLGGGTLFAWAAHEVRRAARFLSISLALFCFTLLLRELELKGESVPAWITWLSTSTPRNVSLICSWTWLLIASRGDIPETWQVFRRWLRTPAGRVMLVAGLVYALTWPFDKRVFDLTRSLNIFLEELGDSTAAVLVLLSGTTTLRQQALMPEQDAPRRAERETAENGR